MASLSSTIRASAPLAAAFAVLLALAQPASSVEAPYEIDVISPSTGPGAFIARGVQTSLSVLEEYVNSEGGIHGRPIHFAVLDDQSNPATAVQLMNQVSADHASVVLGPMVASTCAAVVPLIAAGPVTYCISNSVHPPSGSFMFSAQLSTKDFAMAGLRYLAARGVTKIALLTSTDAAGQDGENIAIEDLRSPELRNLKLVADEHFNPGDIAINAQMARIQASGAQAIDAWTTGSPFGAVLHGIRDAGWNGIVMTNGGNINKAQMVGYAAVMPSELIFVGPPYMAVSGLPAATVRAKDVFLAQMHRAGIEAPDLTQMIAWDPGLIVVDALRHLGTSAKADQIRKYIANLHDFVGINGVYDFRRKDQRGLDPATSVVVRWDPAQATFVPVSKPGGVPL